MTKEEATRLISECSFAPSSISSLGQSTGPIVHEIHKSNRLLSAILMLLIEAQDDED